MNNLPPYQVPFAIAGCYPELTMLDVTAQATIKKLIEESSQTSAFTQVIGEQGVPSADKGWAILKPITPIDVGHKVGKADETYYRWDLSDKTCQALPIFLSDILTTAMNDSTLQGLVWNWIDGVVPSPQKNVPSLPNWVLETLSPKDAVAFTSVTFTGASSEFQLSTTNKYPRHLGVYIEFLQDGEVISPGRWSSRLPEGVATDYETATLKYLGVLPPTTAVAGMVVSTDPVIFSVDLPDGADTIRVVFGGLGRGVLQKTADVAGVMLSFVLDYALPVILNTNKITVAKAESWCQGVRSDGAIQKEILLAGQYLLTDHDVTTVSTILQSLADTLAGLFLGSSLGTLRKKIDKEFGDDTVANALSNLGWGAQTLRALLDSAQPSMGGVLLQTTTQLLSVPPTFSLAFAPDTLVDLAVKVDPDSSIGEFPSQASGYVVEIFYGGGLSQKQSGTVSQDSVVTDLEISFGSIRNDGSPVTILVSLNDKSGRMCAKGLLTYNLKSNQRQQTLCLSVVNEPVVIDKESQYTHRCKLVYGDGQFAWEFGGPPTAVKTDVDDSCKGAMADLCDVAVLTLQSATRSLGYTWRASGQGVGECGDGGTLSVAWFFQNIGTIDPNYRLKSLSCGFALQPGLVYQNSPPDQALSANSACYLDPRDAQYALRPVLLDAITPFDLTTQNCFARFQENGLTALAIHPDGYGIAVDWATQKMEIVPLTASPVNDNQAPIASIRCGKGDREGLLDGPVGVAITPNKQILVLENGNKRLQSFDIYANPSPLFNASPILPLNPVDTYLDIAVGFEGLIYILSYEGDSGVVANYHLDLYTADGSLLNRTGGVNGAKIQVDSQGRLYTLNYEKITGPGMQTQPSISQWVPG